MTKDSLDPEYIDKGGIDAEKLVDIYSEFGLQMEHDRKPEWELSHLESRYGDLTNEILYLNSIDAVRYNEEKVVLKASERSIAERVNRTMINEKKVASQLLESGILPEYLQEPSITEDYSEPVEGLDQRFDDEVYTRIIEILSDGGDMTPAEISEEVAVDIFPELEPRLRIMERKGSALRKDSGEYRLLTERIDDSFFGEDLNVRGALKQEEQKSDNPWRRDF